MGGAYTSGVGPRFPVPEIIAGQINISTSASLPENDSRQDVFF
jgi:hypothetical protein